MNPGKAVRRLIAMMLPWPPRRERKAAIASARAARDASRKQAEHAAGIGRDIRRIAIEDNHFAQKTMDAFRGVRGDGS